MHILYEIAQRIFFLTHFIMRGYIKSRPVLQSVVQPG